MRVIVLAAAALTLAGCAATSIPTAKSTEHAPSAIVPWLDQPAAHAIALHVPSWRRPPAPQTAPRCGRHSLGLRQVSGNGAGGTEFLQLEWVNLTARACRAVGYPTIAALTGHGVVPFRLTHIAAFFDGPPANIAPRHVAFATFSSSLNCPRGQHAGSYQYGRFEVRLPSGDTFVVHGPHLERVCGTAVEPLGVPLAIRRVQHRQLLATLHVPNRLRPGWLNYTVTIANPYRVAYAMSPCPTYQEDIGGVGAGTEVRYRLNCSRVRAIPPNDSITYAMRVRVPMGRSDLVKFGWFMDGRLAPGTATNVSVG